jgi:L-alanine-DL-glutamate epimerase-like enolase superfamily enzyme
MQSDIRIKDIQTHYSHEVARTPLKFGAVVVDAVEFCRVKATVENRNGEVAEGWGGIFLMDFWGWPDPTLPHEAKAAAMHDLAERYASLVRGHVGFAHPVDIFVELEDDLHSLNSELCAERHLTPPQPFLGALVCASPVDAALHDAFGLVNGIDSYQGYGPDFMPDLGKYLGPGFAGKYVASYLRPQYLPRVPVFHLVGGLDKLTRAELAPDDPDDGIPNCLADWITREGMYCLKVKLRGTDLDWDVERTLAVHRIGQEELAAQGRSTMHLTADTNEQCQSPEYIVEYLHRIREASPECYDRILYVEQPTERDLLASRHDMRPVAALKPVIVDESLTDLETFDLALSQGWSGIALKTCKGHSADMLYAAKAGELGIPYTVQDLTNPGIALIHSVGLGARTYTMLGVEANSRQFFPGSTTDAEKSVHHGIFSLQGGEADTSSLRGPGLGYQMDRLL